VLLAIDARSRAISIGFLDPDRSGSGTGRWLSRRRLGAVAGRSADEYALILRGLAGEAAGRAMAPGAAGGLGDAPLVESAWMSCVAPSIGRELSRAVASAFGLACALVGPGLKSGVKIRTEVPSELGSDLVCAAAAARELGDCPCVVVDFDAAIAFSAIGRSGDFLGAAIAPGLATAAESLRAAAVLLPEVPMEESRQGREGDRAPAIGRNTAQSVRAGIGIGYSGLVERIVRLQREELAAMGEADTPESVAVLGTGEEEGRAILASLGLGRFMPDLVLEGLAVIAARAKPAAKTVA
jgi:type III pantothenate kinase